MLCRTLFLRRRIMLIFMTKILIFQKKQTQNQWIPHCVREVDAEKFFSCRKNQIWSCPLNLNNPSCSQYKRPTLPRIEPRLQLLRQKGGSEVSLLIRNEYCLQAAVVLNIVRGFPYAVGQVIKSTLELLKFLRTEIRFFAIAVSSIKFVIEPTGWLVEISFRQFCDIYIQNNVVNLFLDCCHGCCFLYQRYENV